MEALVFYTYETVQALTALPFGAVAPRSSDDTLMRVVNASETYQAEDVAVVLSGPDATQMWLSLDGDVFSAAINVGDIPPSSASIIFTLRRVTPGTAPDGACTADLAATPTSWSTPIDHSSSGNLPLDTP